MNILVAGGAGYIGNVLVPMLLKEGHGVVVLDNLTFGYEELGYFIISDPYFSLIEGDICNVDDVQFALEDIDVVINLVSLRWAACDDNPAMAAEVNWIGNAILTLGAAGRCKIVYSSTCSLYGDHNGLVDEEVPVELTSIYAGTKKMAEDDTLIANGTALRLATVCGLSPCMRYDTLVNGFVRDAVRDRKLEIYAPDAWRPLIHVKDAAKAFVWSLDAPPGIFNVGGENYRKIDLADMLKEEIPDLEITTVPKKDKRNYRASFEKIRQHGFECEHTVKEAILEILEDEIALGVRNKSS